jgi:hypothetical protein
MKFVLSQLREQERLFKNLKKKINEKRETSGKQTDKRGVISRTKTKCKMERKEEKRSIS